MKNILLWAAICLLLSACARTNVFDLPPDHPVIDSLYPAAGIRGDQIRLYGSGFSVHPSLNQVSINGVALAVDSPSTSTVLLVRLVDNTGTGKVHVSVLGKDGIGPLFTYGLGSGVGDKPRIVEVKRGWNDGSGYSTFVTRVPPQNGDIRLKVNGVDVQIHEILRPADPLEPVELRCSDSDWEDHIPLNFADVVVTGAGRASDVYRFQVPPRYPNLRYSEYHAGDTMLISGDYFGEKNAASRVTFMSNGGNLTPDPAIFSWSNRQIRVIVPKYTGLPPHPAWGDRVGMGFGLQVGVLYTWGINTFWYML